MPRKKKRPNPFDELCKCLDMQATFDDNVKRVYALLTKGEFDLHIVAEILVEAATMPVLAQENLKLCDAVKDLTHKLDIADECIKDYSERMKNAAIASQEGVTVEDEHRTVRFLKFPKGSAVN